MVDAQNLNRRLLQFAAQAAGTVNSDDVDNIGAKGVVLVIDTTALTGTLAMTVTIQGKDPYSNKYYTILASASIAATGTVVLRVFPGATAATNLAANDSLPRTWRVSVVVGGSTPTVTATISALTVL